MKKVYIIIFILQSLGWNVCLKDILLSYVLHNVILENIKFHHLDFNIHERMEKVYANIVPSLGCNISLKDTLFSKGKTT